MANETKENKENKNLQAEVVGAETVTPVSEMTKAQIRCLISSFYDIQKERICLGNRIVQSVYMQLGIKKPSEEGFGKGADVKKAKAKVEVKADAGQDKELSAEETKKAEDEESKKALAILLKEYKLIADAVVANKATVKSTISKLAVDKEPLRMVRDITTYRMIEAYVTMQKSEELMCQTVEVFVKQHPLWADYFEGIKGCGPLMAGNCLAYFDIYKAKYCSSLYRYAGLDTVQDTDKEGRALFVKVIDGEITNQKVYEVLGEDGASYYDCETGELWEGDRRISQHGRTRSDTELQPYTDKEGNTAMKLGLTYNPALKCKLVGVLADCIIKAKDPTYDKIYRDYKARLDLSPKTQNLRPAHKDKMAKRYMIKQFLRNLYVHWRKLEGLPVFDSYEVDKLGMKPHAYNEYQHNVALGLVK